MSGHVEKLLTLEDVAHLLAISAGTARKWASQEPHRLPPRQMIPGSPRLWRFHPQVVQAWLAGDVPAAAPRQVAARRGRRRA